jgi:hypothetical protein
LIIFYFNFCFAAKAALVKNPGVRSDWMVDEFMTIGHHVVATCNCEAGGTAAHQAKAAGICALRLPGSKIYYF